jgi:NAD(P)-dependent dehydrogenase (short-subunit alcohol dehydrogenase family)
VIGRHAVVVGGSGMLAGLCRALARDGWEVTVIGRDQGKLARATDGDPRLHPLSVDYENLPAYADALADATAARGPVSLAVCWIRPWAPNSLRLTAGALEDGGHLLHVLGTSAGDASAETVAELESRTEIVYGQVQLGSVSDGKRRRWLTDEEISAGVYAALRAGKSYCLVGTPEG